MKGETVDQNDLSCEEHVRLFGVNKSATHDFHGYSYSNTTV